MVSRITITSHTRRVCNEMTCNLDILSIHIPRICIFLETLSICCQNELQAQESVIHMQSVVQNQIIPYSL